VVSYIRALFDEGTLRMVAVSVGQTMQGRQQMIDDQWHASLRRQIVLLLLAISLVVLGLTMELRPILALKDALATRQPDSLTPCRPVACSRNCGPSWRRSTSTSSASMPRSRCRSALWPMPRTSCVRPWR
jgi:hypothetical protein